MRDDARRPPAPRSGEPPDDRLDAWKEIAAYLGRGVRTVQRWEREEGLPVHRLTHDKRGTIYARRKELDAWWESRRLTLSQSIPDDAAPVSPRVERITSMSALTSWPALSSDSRLIAYVSDGGQDGTTPQIWIQQIGGASLRLTDGERQYSHLSFSPDNTSVIFTAAGEAGPSVYEVPTLGGEPRLLHRDASRGAVSPDGRWLACVPRDGIGIRVAARGGMGFRTVASTLVDVASAIWMPDSRSVLIHARPEPSYEPDWWVVPIDGGSPTNTGIVQLFREEGLFTIPSAAAWMGDFLVVSAAGQPRGVCLYRQRVSPDGWRPSGRPEPVWSGTEAAWQPNAAGGRVAFVASHADANLWSISLGAERGVASGPLRRMTRGPHPLGYLTVSGDFRTLAYFSFRLGRGEIFIRDLRTGSERVLTEAPVGEKGYPAISPSGELLAYGLRMPGGEQAARPILIGRLGDSSWRTLGDDCGGRPRAWVDERRLIIERFARLNSIAMIDTETGDRHDLLVSEDRSLRNPRLSPNRRWIAFDASVPGGPSEVVVSPFGPDVRPESGWTLVDRSASHPFWSADGSLLYYTPTGTNPSVRSAVRGRAFDPEAGLRAEEPIAVYSSNEMLMPAYLPGTAPIATPDQVILVLGDFRGDVWLMELGQATPP